MDVVNESVRSDCELWCTCTCIVHNYIHGIALLTGVHVHVYLYTYMYSIRTYIMDVVNEYFR